MELPDGLCRMVILLIRTLVNNEARGTVCVWASRTFIWTGGHFILSETVQVAARAFTRGSVKARPKRMGAAFFALSAKSAGFGGWRLHPK